MKSQPSILSKISEDIDIKIDHNFLVVTNQVEFSYLAAVITDFLREMLFQAKKSLSLLYQAIKVTDRAYIFDNSGTEPKYIAEITSGKQIEMKINNSPNWSNKYVLSKSF